MTLLQHNLESQAIESRPPTRAGLIWIFEYCLVYTDDPRDILAMGASKRRRKKMGPYYGVIMGEVPDLDPHSPEGSRILYEWIKNDPKIERHKKLKHFLKAHPQVKNDLQREAIRVNGEVVRDRAGRVKHTQKIKTLDRFE